MKATRTGVKGSQLPMEGCTQKDSAEHEGHAGVHNPVRIAETDNTNADKCDIPELIRKRSPQIRVAPLLLYQISLEIEYRRGAKVDLIDGRVHRGYFCL